jgi:hypothetical protein
MAPGSSSEHRPFPDGAGLQTRKLAGIRGAHVRFSDADDGTPTLGVRNRTVENCPY